MRFLFIVTLATLISGSSLWVSAATPVANKTPTLNQAAAVVGEDVNAQLKKAVVDSQAQLGQLDPIQKKIFEEEVVPLYPLFIKDYRQVGTAVSVQVDLENLKKYLRFSAKNLPAGNPQVLLNLRVDPKCTKCVEAAPEIKKMMQSRIERRGFTAIWITAEDLLDTKALELAIKRNAAGALEMSLKPAPMDDVDSAHADEKKFIETCGFDVRGVVHYEDQSEIFDTDSFEQTSAKLLTQAFTELGAKADLVLAASGTNKQEIQIEVNGISSFAAYNQLKTSLQNKFKDVALIEERKMSKGKVVFVLRTARSLEEMRKLLKGIPLDTTQTIQMDVK